MDARETLRMAGRSIRSHKLRSALTVIGVVIGIASVVTFASVGASVEADIVSEVGSSSASNVYVLPSPAGEDDGGPGFGGVSQPVFTEHDVGQLENTPGIRQVLPRGNVRVSALTHANDTVSRNQITATTPASFPKDAIVAGRAFRSGAEEAVVSRSARQAFEGNLSVGDRLTIESEDGNATTVDVVGVVNRTAGQLPFASFAGQPRFYVPTDPFYERTLESPAVGASQRAYPQLTVVADPARVSTVKGSVQNYLAGSDAAELKPESVELTAQTSGDFVEEIQDIVGQVTRFVTAIAVIALVVAAIGIANIMLVSVAERTREIGIMKAVGARNRDVMGLFLAEATILGAVGAIIGLPLGVAVSYGATIYAEVAFTPAYGWFAIAVAVGILVGVVAGLYPAWRAARVDPIDALRYE
ncbi:ABC transporter permease [Halococcus qingdaonensis]|uniref:ABC transporter permease n=1 Tax=Halococcus qingdaonensis TaxID=224402 RepID=UPI002115CEDC|nr:ABC transporter permease [Halococcus qingdaonensis]